MRSPRIIRTSLVGAALAGTLVLTACSGSNPSPASSSAGSAGSGINVQQAKTDLDAVIGGSDTITLPPVGKSIPTGKTINFITCPVAICTEVGNGVEEAATALGWKVSVVANDQTPAGYKEAWKQIAQNPGDGVVNSGPALPYSAITAEMDQAGVPVVSSTSPSPVDGHLISVIASSSGIKLEGELQANWVIQDAGKPVKSVFVYDPSIPALVDAWPGYQEAMKKNCPDCEVDLLKVSVAQIGPALAQQVVGHLQSNPDVAYVGFGLGDLAIGVPGALRAAGLQDQVKITTRAATPANLVDVKSGGITAAFTSEVYESGWRTVDKLARSFAGAPIGEPYPLGINRLITKDNIPTDVTVPYTVPDYAAAFKKAWGVG